MRAIYIGKHPLRLNEIGYLSYGQTGEIVGESLDMYAFEPDGSGSELSIKPWKQTYLVERKEIYIPAS